MSRRDVASLPSEHIHKRRYAMSHQRRNGLPLLIVAALLISMLGTTRAGAQSTFATLTGTVIDQSGAVLPGVTVTVTNVTTGVTRSVTSIGTGEYQLPNL